MANDFQSAYEEMIRNLYSQVDTDQNVPAGVQNYLKSPNGTFLGSLNHNHYDPNSIYNQYGQYGSIYSSLSIFNQYGQYGSIYSSTSPFSQYAAQPPEVYLNRRKVGYLTVNRYMTPQIQPAEFLEEVRTNPKYAR
jgi:hypothetical protein